MPAAEAETLADIYRGYRARLHRLALAGRPRLAPREEFQDSIDTVSAGWQRYMLA